MRKVDIVRRIAEDTACTTTQADEAVEAILATVKEGLQQGDSMILQTLWHVSCAGQAGTRRPQPPERSRRRHCGPAGRALHTQPDVDAGRGWGNDCRGIGSRAACARRPAQARSGAMSSSVRPAVSGNHLATSSAPGTARVARTPIATQCDVTTP